MNWDTLFTQEKNVSAEETKLLMASSDFDQFQLLDVRQPKEYEESHIPGAILMPLASLPTRNHELDRNKSVVVYCRSGVRSKAACQILSRADLRDVYNMTGGILAWQGEQSEGTEEAGLEYFTGGDFATSFGLALQMEAGLKEFYEALASRAENEEEKRMLSQMARLEDGHLTKLRSKYRETITVPLLNSDLHIIEGGLGIDEMLTVSIAQLGTPEKVLQLGMKLEAQAFDLYCRLAREHIGTQTAMFYQEMAREEQQHLQRLAKELDAFLEQE